MAELSVVIPAFNEEGAIREVLSEWIRELERLAIDYEMLVYNDGSSDRTGSLLQEIAQHNPRLQVASQPNRGHGGPQPAWFTAPVTFSESGCAGRNRLS